MLFCEWSVCCGWRDCCFSWGACSFKCVAMGRIFVSECRCAVLVSSVQPVMVRRALFCTVCSLLMFVLEVIGDHIVLAYSIMGRVMVF